MANRQSECIKVRKSAFSIRLDLLGTFCIKAKGAEEKSMAKGAEEKSMAIVASNMSTEQCPGGQGQHLEVSYLAATLHVPC
jgi:hypothetical protein